MRVYWDAGRALKHVVKKSFLYFFRSRLEFEDIKALNKAIVEIEN